MKFTLSWLNNHLEHNKSTKEVLDALVMLGLEVEEVIDYKQLLSPYSIGYIKEATAHPNADKLKVCKVDTINGELQIVCGAHNARAGIYVVFGKVGTYVKALDITLKEANIRGVASFGMMLSEKELGISEEHGAIIEFNNGKVGDEIGSYLGLDDTLIEIAITPNRGDCLGVAGIAKDLSAYWMNSNGASAKLKNPAFLLQGQELKALPKTIEINNTSNIAQRFALIKVENIDNNIVLPAYITRSLELIGQKSINPIVDLFNYLCVDINQPFHVYDFDKINNPKSVDLILAKQDDKFNGLDGVSYNLKNNTPLVMFDNQIGAIAGILGGMDSSCDNNTKNILIEIANFDKEVISFAKRDLAINTTSAYRFERQIDSNPNLAYDNVVYHIKKLFSGAKITGFSAVENEISKQALELSLNYVNSILSMGLTLNEVAQILTRLDFSIVKMDEVNKILHIMAPSYRNYIVNCADVVGDILRIYGSDKLQSIKYLPNNAKSVIYNKNHYLSLIAKKNLANEKLYETINMSFISNEEANIFGIYDDKLTLSNPISNNLSIMRQSLAPSLTKIAKENINRGEKNLAIFEVANVYKNDGSQELVAGILLSGNAIVSTWQQGNKAFDVWDIKLKLLNFLEAMNINYSAWGLDQKDIPSFYHLGRGASYTMGRGNVVAHFGQLNPMVLKDLEIKQNIFCAEVFLNRLPIEFNIKQKPINLPNFMPIERDFAFLLNQDVSANEVIKLIKAVDKKFITNVYLFDVYQGDKIASNLKSLAIKVIIQPLENNLSEEEISTISNNIINTITTKLGGTLRDK
jgi:phenylalanyl-tRNA synthetase beta chain